MTSNPTPGLGDDLRALRRSRDDRVVAGVLGGVARRLGIDPILLRILTVVLAVFGGVGIVFYALGWLLIPDADDDSSIAEQSLGRHGRSPQLPTVALAVALVIAILIATGGTFNSGTGTLLLVLTIVGAVLLLRRRDEEGTPPPPGEPAAYPSDPVHSAYYPPSAAEPSPDLVAGPPSTPAAEPAAYPAATSSTGWPEGPDWEPPSPYAADSYAPASPPAPQPRPRSLLGPLTVSAIVVALGILAINDATWASIPVSAYIATALAIVGAGLLIGSWVGRSRGLIALGLLLTLTLPPAVFVADELNLTADHSTVTVARMDQVPDGPQSHGSGQVTYDLSSLELTDEDEIVLEIDQSLGQLRIIVPPEADVTLSASLGMGQIEAFDGMSAGIRPTRSVIDLGPDGAGGGSVTLDLDVAMGQIEVTR